MLPFGEKDKATKDIINENSRKSEMEYEKWYQRVKWTNDRSSMMCKNLYQNIPEALHENTSAIWEANQSSEKISLDCKRDNGLQGEDKRMKKKITRACPGDKKVAWQNHMDYSVLLKQLCKNPKLDEWEFWGIIEIVHSTIFKYVSILRKELENWENWFCFTKI